MQQKPPRASSAGSPIRVGPLPFGCAWGKREDWPKRWMNQNLTLYQASSVTSSAPHEPDDHIPQGRDRWLLFHLLNKLCERTSVLITAKPKIRDKPTSSIFTFVVVRLDKRRAGRVAFDVSLFADAANMGLLYNESGSQSVLAKATLADLKSFRTADSPPRAAGSSGLRARLAPRT